MAIYPVYKCVVYIDVSIKQFKEPSEYTIPQLYTRLPLIRRKNRITRSKP